MSTEHHHHHAGPGEADFFTETSDAYSVLADNLIYLGDLFSCYNIFKTHKSLTKSSNKLSGSFRSHLH